MLPVVKKTRGPLWNELGRTIFDRPIPTIFDHVDDLLEPPSGGAVTRWLLGFIVPLAPIGLGIHSLLTHKAVFPGRGGLLEFHGTPADTLGIASLALGVFLHAHYFWETAPLLRPFANALKVLSLLVFLPCLGFTLLSFF